MSDTGDILKEFLVAIGYKLDEESAKKVDADLVKLEKKIIESERRKSEAEDKAARASKERTRQAVLEANLLADAIERGVKGFISATVDISAGLEKMYYAGQRTGASVQHLKAFQYAAGQTGSSVDKAAASVEALGNSLRDIPNFRDVFKGMGIDAAGKDAEQLLRAFGDRFRGALPGSNEYAVASQYAKRIGLDDDTFRTLIGKGDKFFKFFDEYNAKMRKQGIDLEAASKGAVALGNSWRDMWNSIESIEMKVLSDPKLVGSLVKDFDAFGAFIDRDGDKIATGIVHIADSVLQLSTTLTGLLASDAMKQFMDKFSEDLVIVDKILHAFGNPKQALDDIKNEVGSKANGNTIWGAILDLLPGSYTYAPPGSKAGDVDPKTGLPIIGVNPHVVAPRADVLDGVGSLISGFFSGPASYAGHGPGRSPSGPGWGFGGIFPPGGLRGAAETAREADASAKLVEAVERFTDVARVLSENLLRVLYSTVSGMASAASTGAPVGIGSAPSGSITPAAPPTLLDHVKNVANGVYNWGRGKLGLPPVGPGASNTGTGTQLSALNEQQRQQMVDAIIKQENAPRDSTNPGNLMGHSFATREAGRQGIYDLLFKSKMYKGKTIQSAMEKYAPWGHGANNPDVYARNIAHSLTPSSPKESNLEQPNLPQNGPDPQLVGGANLMTGGEFTRRTGITPKVGQDLVTVTTAGGHTFTVNKWAAPNYKAFVEDLEKRGYDMHGNPQGYNPRSKFGSGGLSEHAYGNAVDINPGANPFQRNTGNMRTDMPPEISQIAAKYGLSWGGDWHSVKDPMHFEWRGKPLAADRAASGIKPATADDVKKSMWEVFKSPANPFGKHAAGLPTDDDSPERMARLKAMGLVPGTPEYAGHGPGRTPSGLVNWRHWHPHVSPGRSPSGPRSKDLQLLDLANSMPGDFEAQAARSRNLDTLMANMANTRLTPPAHYYGGAPANANANHVAQHNSTTINVTGGSDPHETSRMVASSWNRHNAGLLRRLQGAVQ